MTDRLPSVQVTPAKLYWVVIQDAIASELATSEAFATFLSEFEAGTIPKAEWTHAAHVAMAAGYLQRMPAAQAIDAVRAGIHNLLKHFGVETTLERGYHETLTRLWVYTLDAWLQESGVTGLEAIRSAVAVYGRRGDLHRDYYSNDVVRDPEARYGWLPPDRQALPAAWRRAEMLVSTNPRLLHSGTIHEFLASSSYWAANIPRSVVERSLRNSLCFGLYDSGSQVGFARVITDLATFAYLGDVFVLDSHRRRGFAVWLMECVRNHPSLAGFRRWHLVTRDAHELYEKTGFRPLAHPERHMEKIIEKLYGG